MESEKDEETREETKRKMKKGREKKIERSLVESFIFLPVQVNKQVNSLSLAAGRLTRRSQMKVNTLSIDYSTFYHPDYF